MVLSGPSRSFLIASRSFVVALVRNHLTASSDVRCPRFLKREAIALLLIGFGVFSTPDLGVYTGASGFSVDFVEVELGLAAVGSLAKGSWATVYSVLEAWSMLEKVFGSLKP